MFWQYHGPHAILDDFRSPRDLRRECVLQHPNCCSLLGISIYDVVLPKEPESEPKSGAGEEEDGSESQPTSTSYPRPTFLGERIHEGAINEHLVAHALQPSAVTENKADALNLHACATHIRLDLVIVM